MYDSIKAYLKIHWVAMLFGAVLPTLIGIITLINIFIAFRIDYAALKEEVAAQTVNGATILVVHQKILDNITQMQQEQKDDHQLLEDIHNYLLNK